MQLGDYKHNPILLWMHDPHNPVARCTQIGVEDGALRGTGQFPPLGTTALADEICGLVKSGVVNAVSVGFEPIDTVPLDPKKPRGGLRILTSSLIEIFPRGDRRRHQRPDHRKERQHHAISRCGPLPARSDRRASIGKRATIAMRCAATSAPRALCSRSPTAAASAGPLSVLHWAQN